MVFRETLVRRMLPSFDRAEDGDGRTSFPQEIRRMIVRRIGFSGSWSDNTARPAREAKSPRRPARRATAAEGVLAGAHSA